MHLLLTQAAAAKTDFLHSILQLVVFYSILHWHRRVQWLKKNTALTLFSQMPKWNIILYFQLTDNSRNQSVKWLIVIQMSNLHEAGKSGYFFGKCRNLSHLIYTSCQWITLNSLSHQSRSFARAALVFTNKMLDQRGFAGLGSAGYFVGIPSNRPLPSVGISLSRNFPVGQFSQSAFPLGQHSPSRHSSQSEFSFGISPNRHLFQSAFC